MNRPHITLLVCLFCLPLVFPGKVRPQSKPTPPQQSAAQSAGKSETPERESGTVELLSTELVSSIETVDGLRFSANDKFLVVRVGLERGFGYSTDDFVLTSKRASEKEEKKMVCIGATVNIPNGWAVNKAGMVWSLYPGGKGMLKDLGLLFFPPNDSNEVTLKYKGRPVGAPISIKRE